MMPIVLIILGLLLFFFSAVRLLRFSSELSDKIEEINDLFSSDAFMMHRELKQEVDELNYSYYEILERQDERISDLEGKMDKLAAFDFFNVGEEQKTVKNISNPQAMMERKSLDSGAFDAIDSKNSSSNKSFFASGEGIKEEDGSIGTFSLTENYEDEDAGALNAKILKMYKEGASVEKIASDLDVGVGMVEMVCSIYHK